MNTNEPKRWWFLLPLPAALLLAYVICLVRYGSEGLDHALSLAGPCALFGGLTFPIGLASFFCSARDFLADHMWTFAVSGYIGYLALSITGAVKRSRSIFVILVALLLLNVVGCQLERTEGMFAWERQRVSYTGLHQDIVTFLVISGVGVCIRLLTKRRKGKTPPRQMEHKIRDPAMRPTSRYSALEICGMCFLVLTALTAGAGLLFMMTAPSGRDGGLVKTAFAYAVFLPAHVLSVGLSLLAQRWLKRIRAAYRLAIALALVHGMLALCTLGL